MPRGSHIGGLSTTERGYGWAHQQARTAALQAMYDGQPCTRCHHPMYRSQHRTLDLDHGDDRATYRGLAHARCNRQAGQRTATQRRLTNRTRNTRVNAVNSRAW